MQSHHAEMFFHCATFFLASCSTARLGQFSQFAATGQTYTVALPKILDVALQSTIEANSSELVETRDKITDPNERANKLAASDKEIHRRVQAFQVIKTQTNLLGAYFTGIAALAESDAGEGLAKSTQGAADALAKISKDAATLKIGEAHVKDVLGDVVPIVIAAFQRAKLEQVLKATQKLKLAFVDLVENKSSSASLTLLLQDIQRLISLAERISGKSQTEGA